MLKIERVQLTLCVLNGDGYSVKYWYLYSLHIHACISAVGYMI